jgi:hypothetical protein
MEIVKAAPPVPDVGETTSHGTFDVAVQVTVPIPVCESRTVWRGVLELNELPVVTAPNLSDARLSDIVGGGKLKIHAAPTLPLSPGPPMMAVLPSPERDTENPSLASPTAPVPTSLGPC